MNDAIIIAVTTVVLVLFAVGYIVILLESNKKIIREQQRRLDEIQKSEQRYKALFENSLAGIFRFDFMRWEILDANQSAYEMFNSKSIKEFQEIFLSLPAEKLEQIESTLKSNGSIDDYEIIFRLPTGIVRKFEFSARREQHSTIAHAVIVFVTAGKLIG